MLDRHFDIYKVDTRLKVTHVIHSIDRSKGGPSTYMQLITNHLVKLPTVTGSDDSQTGHEKYTSKASHHMTDAPEIEVVTLDTPDPIPLSSPITHHSSPQASLGLFGYSSEMRNYFQNIRTDLFHGNGLWQYPVHAMAAAARKRKIPYILSTHGMLEPWSMTQGKLKKQLAMQLFQKKDLQQAKVIHCTALMEAETIRKLGFKSPIAVIPNGIDETEFEVEIKKNKVPRQLLFLSRIHRKKGLEMLFRSFSSLDKKITDDWKIIIAGGGEEEYVDSLKKLADELNLSEKIEWAGEVYGPERKKKLQQADLFILPTFSENFGIVVAESLASGVPVITTTGAPWADLEKHGCGWWSPIGEDHIKAALTEALAKTPKELSDMGLKGRQLVEEKYSIKKVAEQMLELYRWVLGKGDRPGFVV